MTPYKTIFFDLDDTLWCTERNNKECLEEIFVDYGFVRHYASFEAFYDTYMLHNLHLWKQYRDGKIRRNVLVTERFLHVLRPMGIEDETKALAINHDFLQRTTRKTLIMDGAIELLEYLRPAYRLCVISNGFREIQHQKLTNSGMAHYFQRVILSEDAGIHKPHKAIFDFALTNTNSRRTRSLMIGDSWEADVIGARQSKIDQIWFNPYGFPAQDMAPTYTVKALLEIKSIL